jgi:predicted RNA-binding protein associated with RNAse of E/G family
MLPDGWTGAYEDYVWHTNRALFLYRPGNAHSVGVFWREADGAFQFWYVNLEAPWRRTPLGFDTLDHTLDVVLAPDLRSWAWKDEDEFAWCQEVGIITPPQAAAIRAEGERAIAAAAHRASPYCDGWERWEPDPVWAPLTEMPANWGLTEQP